MTHVVTSACINCKYGDCVTVCPVACFFEGPNMLVIDPDICIDCGVCVTECPVNAIEPDNTEEGQKWLNHNREYSKKWPNIEFKKDPMPEAEKYAKIKDKSHLFNPGE